MNTNEAGSSKAARGKKVFPHHDHLAGRPKIRYSFVPSGHLLGGRLLPTSFYPHLFAHTHQSDGGPFDELFVSWGMVNATGTRFIVMEESR